MNKNPLQGYSSTLFGHEKSTRKPIHWFLERDVVYPTILRLFLRSLETGQECPESEIQDYWYQIPEELPEADTSRIFSTLNENGIPRVFVTYINCKRIKELYGSGVYQVELAECDPETNERLDVQQTALLIIQENSILIGLE